MAQLIQDPVLVLTPAFEVPKDALVSEIENINYIDAKSTLMQTCFLSSAGSIYLLDHKDGFTPWEFLIKESFLKHSIV